MSSSLHERLFTDPVEGCVLEFLDKAGTTFVPYACGKCAVIACRDEDGVTEPAEGHCLNLLIDAPDRAFDSPGI